jgi:hypothetical protein
MRRSLKRPRIKRVRPPKPILAPKPERPRRSTLKTIYKDLISSDQEQRVNTLRRALGWFDSCVTYVGYNLEDKYQWTKSALRHKNLAEKNRAAGITSSNEQTKEQSFLTSVKEYEKLVNGFKPPKVITYQRRLSHEKSKLDTRKKRLSKRFGEFLKTLQVMLKPTNYLGVKINLKVDKLSTEYRIDSKGNITFDTKFLTYVYKLSRKQGMLTAVVEIIPMLMEAAGRMDELDHNIKTGKIVVSNSKCKQSVQPMLRHLNQYYLSVDSPKKLVRKPKTKRRKI